MYYKFDRQRLLSLIIVSPIIRSNPLKKKTHVLLVQLLPGIDVNGIFYFAVLIHWFF